MIKRTRLGWPRRLASAAACCLFWWTAGCSSLVGAPGVHRSVFPADATPGPSLRPGPAGPASVTTTYRVAPALGLGEQLQARPWSLSGELFNTSTFDRRCQPVPPGLLEVLEVPCGRPATPLGRLGPLEVGVQGIRFSPLHLPAYLASLDEGRLVEGGATLADRGLACGCHSFVYLRIALFDSEPVAVSR